MVCPNFNTKTTLIIMSRVMSSNSSIEKQLTLWFGYFPSRLMLSNFSVEKMGNFVVG
jgi:hypothetical protein